MTSDKKPPRPHAGAFVRLLPTLCVAAGIIAIPCGVAMISLPAGIITAGSLCIIVGILMTLGGVPGA